MFEKRTEINFDIPSEHTSSIGATVWPPVEASFERKKGFHPDVLESPEDLNNFLEEFDNLPFGNSTRISVRAIVNNQVFSDINKIKYPRLLETVIPLAGCGEPLLEDCCLVYFGKNDERRIPPPEITSQQLKSAKEIFTKEKRNHDKRLSHQPDIDIIVLDPQQLTEDILTQYYKLYQPFRWTREQVEEMLTSPNNIFIYAQTKTEEIASSVLGEKGAINVKRNNQNVPLLIVEITEAATHPNFRGNGFYQKVSNALLNHLAQLSPHPPHLVFGELNLDSKGVLRVAAKQRRIPAWQIAEEIGLPDAWMLPQHVTIDQGENIPRPDNYPYNNLMVAFLPRQLLLKYYGQTTNS